MTWNYRIIRRKDPDGEYYYQIHEVCYGIDRDIAGWSDMPIEAGGDSMNELENDLNRMLSAINKPVLEEFEGKLEEVE